ncbi:unnamed protein product [Caenorhabditis brenneri]
MVRFIHLVLAFLIRHASQSPITEIPNIFKPRSARFATAKRSDKDIQLTLFLFFFGLLVLLTFIWFVRKRRREIVTRRNRFFSTIRYTPAPTRSSVNIDSNDEEPHEELFYRLNRLGITYNIYKKKYEIDPLNLKVNAEKLGDGQYGFVNVGYLHNGEKRLKVAVKRSHKPHDEYEQGMFMAELTVMCAIEKHPNVLALIGGVTLTKPNKIVMEFVDEGSLLKFLHKYKKNEKDTYKELSTFDLISFAYQIAKGMEHLAKIRCVHRDLASRNVLITSDGITKIGDFGLSRKYENREYYRPRKEDPFKTFQPWLWMAPEAFENNKFTEKSDVWSFAVCLFEIFSLGDLPILNEIMRPFWETADYLPQPKYCSDEINEFMKLCWSKNPDARPTFSECCDFFEKQLKNRSVKRFEDLEKKFKKISKEHKTFKNWAGIN